MADDPSSDDAPRVSPALQRLREAIDAVDVAILEQLNERARLVQQVGQTRVPPPARAVRRAEREREHRRLHPGLRPEDVPSDRPPPDQLTGTSGRHGGLGQAGPVVQQRIPGAGLIVPRG